MSSSFIGKKFYDKAYTTANPTLHFQHRGKGRWYLVTDADAAVPPPQKRLLKIKAEKGKASKTDPDMPKEPKEPRAIRKRTAVDLDDPVELMETRTRKGSAPNLAIEFDQAPKASAPKESTRAIKRRKSPAAVAAVEGISSEIAVAPANPSKPKSPAKKKAAPRKKKTRAPPKPRAPQTAAQAIDNYDFAGPKGLSEDRALRSELKSDLEAMGLTKTALGKRKAEPSVDNATQRIGTNLRKALDLGVRAERFDKKQLQNAEARANGSVAKGPTADGAGNTQIIVEDEGMLSNWVLFDPRHGFPPTIGTPPKIFEQLEYYQPGNDMIVAYNTESFSCHIRKTPDAFAGREVHYTNRGPRLIKLRTQRTLLIPEDSEQQSQQRQMEKEQPQMEKEQPQINEPEIEKSDARADSPLSELTSTAA